MIDFACKKFDINEVIRCGFGLTRAEFIILRYFVSNANSYIKTEESSRLLKLEVSTVQRAVKKLYLLNLLERKQKNLSSGGYVYEYKIRSKKEIKNKVLELIGSWTKRVENEFDSW